MAYIQLSFFVKYENISPQSLSEDAFNLSVSLSVKYRYLRLLENYLTVLHIDDDGVALNMQ